MQYGILIRRPEKDDSWKREFPLSKVKPPKSFLFRMQYEGHRYVEEGSIKALVLLWIQTKKSVFAQAAVGLKPKW